MYSKLRSTTSRPFDEISSRRRTPNAELRTTARRQTNSAAPGLHTFGRVTLEGNPAILRILSARSLARRGLHLQTPKPAAAAAPSCGNADHVKKVCKPVCDVKKKTESSSTVAFAKISRICRDRARSSAAPAKKIATAVNIAAPCVSRRARRADANETDQDPGRSRKADDQVGRANRLLPMRRRLGTATVPMERADALDGCADGTCTGACASGAPAIPHQVPAQPPLPPAPSPMKEASIPIAANGAD